MVTNIELIELEEAAGLIRLEWATDHGVGASFQPDVTDEALSRVPETIRSAVWLNLENTQITDVGLAKLEGAPVLESVRLVGSKVTNNGILRLLISTPTIQDLVVEENQLSSADLAIIHKSCPQVVCQYASSK